MSKDHDYDFKIILIGESGVGKTSLTLRYTTGTFKARGVETVVANFFSKSVTTKGKTCKLSIWDTAGQERYKSMVQCYYRNVDGVLLVYDVTNIMTFNQLSSWLKEIRDISGGATTLIVGNKTDHHNGLNVSRTVVKRFARDENLEFMESSAKTGENVDKIFEYLTLRILQDKRILPFDVHLSVSSFTSLDMPEEEMSGTTSTKPEQTKSCLENLASNQQPSNTTKAAEIDHIPSSSNTLHIENKASVNKHNSSNPNISETAFSNGTSNHVSQNSTDLPPIVPLTDDIIELYVERRRKSSTGSVISFMPDVDELSSMSDMDEICLMPNMEEIAILAEMNYEIEGGIKLHEYLPNSQKRKTSCNLN